MKRNLIRLLLALAVGVAASSSLAQDFPSKPVRIILGSGAGGSGDLIMRSMAPGMSKVLGQTVIVENMPGAQGLQASRYVAKQVPADGYVLLSQPTTALAHG